MVHIMLFAFKRIEGFIRTVVSNMTNLSKDIVFPGLIGMQGSVMYNVKLIPRLIFSYFFDFWFLVEGV